MKRLTIAAFGALLTALVSSGFGCELIASVDRSKIDQGGGGAGGAPTGGGGTGGTPVGGGGTGGTGGTPCTSAAECDPPAEECLEATCDGGMCGAAPKPAGTPGARQTAGDCKVSQCDGAGALVDVDDDADVPDDGNECTLDACDAGVPSNTPVAEDSPCGVNGMLVCDANGQCVDCLEAADCGADTECQTRTCDMGVCGVVNAAQGTALAAQTAGDCQVAQCDGMGGVESAEDNADMPVDGTACTDDLCSMGVPSNPPVAAGTACTEGTGTLCDDMGACVECLTQSDCPGVDDECQTRTCVAGVCGFDFTAAGTPLMAQTTGDCQLAVCDGAGGVTSADQDTDLPNDNNPCTDDTCSMGAPTFTNVALGTSCGGTQVCDANGQCVGCNTADDCPGVDDECKTRTCDSNVCGFDFTAAGTAVSAQTAADCKEDVCDGMGNVVSQNDDADLPADDGEECTSQACSNGTPAFPPVAADTACTQGGGSFCDGAGACVECNAASQCPAGGECEIATCSNNACGFAFQPSGFVTPTQTPGDCQVNQCDGAGGVVQVDSNGDVPVDGNECTSDVCNAGVPSNPPVAVDTACTQGGGSFCSAAGQCVECNAASQCPAGDECKTATCNSNACGFSFQPSGFVTPTQTGGDCKQNECDGAGNTTAVNLDTDVPVDGNECTGDVCTSGVPSNPALAVDTACNQAGGSFCNGAGLCVECNAASQCPAGDECKTATCDMNACGFSFTAPGTAVSSQTPGDCKQNECDGAGNVAVVNLDTDVPVDGNQCTDDVCTGGVGSNPASPAGTSCNQSGGTACDGAGTCVSPVSCNDSVLNGTETDVDCGGTCPDCADGKMCVTGGDCVSSVCTNGTCEAASCSDGVKNGTETDVDCGGSCPACANSKTCLVNGDCSSAVCDGGTCVECVTASQCPAGDECKTATCTNNACGFSFQPIGFVTPTQTGGDCKQNQCDGGGNVTAVNFDSDVPVDGDQCTDDVCTAGAPSNPAAASGTACSQGGGSVCDGNGVCVECLTAAQCPAGDECKTATCTANTCGFSFTVAGTAVSSQAPGDCKQNQCDGVGNVVAVAFDTDLPDDGNDCTDDVCTAGVPSNPASAMDTQCDDGGGMFCDGNGVCVECTAAGQCPAGDECKTATCNSSVCGFDFTPAGTVLVSQTTGNCQQEQCDGAGGVTSVAFDTDLPVDGSECTDDVCTAGVPSNPAVAAETACSQNGGIVCDGAGSCSQPVVVLRVGDGSAALSTSSTAAFVEERLLSGALRVKAGNPLALPTAVDGSNQPLTLSGTATSEGALSRSVDGAYVTLAGYATAPGMVGVVGSPSATTNRVVGRIDKDLVVDTSTLLDAGFSGGNVRAATSVDGTAFWVSGTGTGGTGGVHYTTLGAIGSTQLNTAPNNSRFVHIFDGQLYGSSGSQPYTNVFAVGTGLPTTTGQTATSLAGLPTTSGPSPYSFVLLDLNAGVAGVDTLYIADDRTIANGGGIQKWTFDGTTWTLAGTLSNGITTGVRGLAGYVSGGTNVTLIATTTQSNANSLVVVIDDGSASPAFTTIATAAANTAFRGVALAPN